jgi:hypothetical protein
MTEKPNDHGPPSEDDFLDREHQARVSRVARCDTAKARAHEAQNEIAALTEEIEELNAELINLGGDEHVDAIHNSPWFPYAEDLAKGARLAWTLDSVFWFGLWGGLWWLWVRYYQDAGETVPSWLYFVGLPAAVILSIVCARASKRFGHKFAVTRLTNKNSVDETIDRQVRFAGRCSVAAGVLLATVLALLFFSPPRWSSVTTFVGGLIGFAANIMLGLAAGVGGQAARLLRKVVARGHIDCLIKMKERARRHLSKFLVIVLIVSGCLATPSQSATADDCVWIEAIDITDSLDPLQRQAGIDAFIDGAFDRAHELGVRAILVMKFSNDLLLADTTLIPVPPLPNVEDCRNVKAVLAVTKGIMFISPTAAAARRQAAVDACVARQDAAQRLIPEQRNRLRDQLRLATKVTPRADVSTLIAPLIRKLVARPYARAIDVLTDGIDDSGIPPASLKIPERVPVTLILTRPNPRRRTPTSQDVLAAADTWAQAKGISVVSVGEYPTLVRSPEVH